MSRRQGGVLASVGAAVLALTTLASTAGAQAISIPDDYVSSERGVRSYQVVAGVELAMILTAVTYRDSDMRLHPIRRDTPYYREVLAHFEPYADHPVFDVLGLVADPESLSGDALRAYTALRNSGYRWHLVGDELEPLDFLGNWWLGEEYADPFTAHADLVRDFARVTGFAGFFRDHQATYSRLADVYAERIDIRSVIGWLEENFTPRYASYRVVFSPLMRGNQSTTRKTDDDSDFVQVFMLVDPPAEDESRASTLLAFRWVFTELDHQYVDPALEPHAERIDAVFSHRDVWAGGLQSDNYRTPFRLFAEYVTWALYLAYLAEHDDGGSWREVAATVVPWFEERRGFPRYGAMVDELIRLRAEEGARVEDLIPALLDWAEEQGAAVGGAPGRP